MTFLTPTGTSLAVPSPSLSRYNPGLDLGNLHDGIADRRRRLLELELGMVIACETAAAHGHAATVQMHDRGTWDHATWQRYLAAAASVEHKYGPPMRQLYREIDQLERVAALPLARAAVA